MSAKLLFCTLAIALLAHRSVSSQDLSLDELDELEQQQQQQEQQQLNYAANEEDLAAVLASQQLDTGAEWNGRQMRAAEPNEHLPGTSPFGGGLSAPVNEPSDFELAGEESAADHEAEFGALAGLLNNELPNTPNRTRLLMQVLDLQQDQLGGEKSLLEYLYADEASKQRDAMAAKQQQQQSAGASEYIDHPLALAGHQLVQGGAGEGRQLLGPEGTFENVQVIKSDSAVPAYCDPPNPCPIGFSAKDNCLENFVNSASFSRKYQAKQQCSCDNEHSLFNCAAQPIVSSSNEVEENKQQQQQEETSTGGDHSSRSSEASMGADEQQERENAAVEAKLSTLARTLQNRFGDLASVRQMIQQHQREMMLERGVHEDNLLVRSARKWSQPLNSISSNHEGAAAKLSPLD